MDINLLILTIISFLISYSLLYLFLPYLKKYFLQKPNLRSSHNSPKPSGGGLVFVLCIALIDSYLGNQLSLICLPLAVIGFIDDILNLNKKIRFLAQSLTSILIIYNSQIISSHLIDLNFLLVIFYIFFLMIFVTGIINFTNFMDGIDGLVCGCFIVIFSAASLILSPSLWIIVGALLGFLPWNWNSSKVFMGDGGSTFLGALLATLLLREQSYDSLKIFIVSAPLFLDAFICLIRRYRFNQPIFRAHNLHLFQRLYQSGWSHSKITILYMLATSLLAFIVVKDLIIILIPTLILIISFGIYLDNFIAIPFKIALEKVRR